MYRRCFLFDIALHDRGTEAAPHSRLPSTAFQRLPWYYPVIRLPCPRLPSFFFVWHTTPVHSGRGGARLSPVDVVSLYSMAGSLTPQQCVESHLTDKHTCCIPRTRTCLPAGFLPFDAGLPALLPNFLRLAYAITDVVPRFATGDVVSILPGRVSTC